MPTYLLTLPVMPMERGRIYTTLPLHCTLVQYFETGEHRDTLIRELRPIFARTPAIELIACERAFFGKRRDVPADVICKTPALAALHDATVTCLTGLGATLQNPEWAHAGYCPHVSCSDGEALSSLSTQVSHVCLIEKLAEGKKVHVIFGLQ